MNLADHILTVQSMEEERNRSEKSMLPLLSWQLTLSNIFFYFVTHSFVNMLEATVELDDPVYFFVCELRLDLQVTRLDLVKHVHYLN